MKVYTLNPTKKQLKLMKLYFKMFDQFETIFLSRICQLEREMSDRIGIPGLEFFKCDGDYVGIGNLDKTMKLIQFEELSK